ncbi:MAG: winged helix-turn-helix domain-containing protein [Rhizobacter sp.]
MATTSSTKASARGGTSAGRKTGSAVKPAAKFRFRITAGDVIAVGPGKISLLEAIDETGSITSAAKSLDMSYRRAWMLLDELNRALRQPAVDSAKGGQNGGGSELTDVGRQLIDTYRRIESTAASACAADIKRLLGLIAP